MSFLCYLIINWFKVIEIFSILRLSEQNSIYHGTQKCIAVKRYCFGLECGTDLNSSTDLNWYFAIFMIVLVLDNLESKCKWFILSIDESKWCQSSRKSCSKNWNWFWSAIDNESFEADARIEKLLGCVATNRLNEQIKRIDWYFIFCTLLSTNNVEFVESNKPISIKTREH